MGPARGQEKLPISTRIFETCDLFCAWLFIAIHDNEVQIIE